MEPLGVYQFKVTRNSDLYVQEEEVANLRRALESELVQRNVRSRRCGSRSRPTAPRASFKYLQRQFRLGDEDVYRVDGPVNLNRLVSIPEQIDRPDLKYPPFTPHIADGLRERSSTSSSTSPSARRSFSTTPTSPTCRSSSWYARRRRDPGRARDQADALPHRRALGVRARR